MNLHLHQKKPPNFTADMDMQKTDIEPKTFVGVEATAFKIYVLLWSTPFHS
jgi:hypothetical protein